MKPEEVELTFFQTIKVLIKTINSFFPRVKYNITFIIMSYMAFTNIFDSGANNTGMWFSLFVSAVIGIIATLCIWFLLPEFIWKDLLKPSLKDLIESWNLRYEIRKLEEQEESLKKIDEIILKK